MTGFCPRTSHSLSQGDHPADGNARRLLAAPGNPDGFCIVFDTARAGEFCTFWPALERTGYPRVSPTRQDRPWGYPHDLFSVDLLYIAAVRIAFREQLVLVSTLSIVPTRAGQPTRIASSVGKRAACRIPLNRLVVIVSQIHQMTANC